MTPQVESRSADRPRRFPPNGRRAAILRATSTQVRSMSEVCAHVAARLPGDRDPSIARLKNSAALKDLKRAGLIARTPHGWTITIQGMRALSSSAEGVSA